MFSAKLPSKMDLHVHAHGHVNHYAYDYHDHYAKRFNSKMVGLMGEPKPQATGMLGELFPNNR
jgi:hypothetical protein